MQLKLEVYSSICGLSMFEINGITADEDDFGDKYDDDPENAEDYGCGNMTFFPKERTEEILRKYKINEDEHKEICKKLEEELSFGECGWCV